MPKPIGHREHWHLLTVSAQDAFTWAVGFRKVAVTR
jgi:hypothetical protein